VPRRHSPRRRRRRRRRRASLQSPGLNRLLVSWAWLRAELTSDNATNYTTGRAAASFTSTTLAPQVVNERQMLDEEERELTEYPQ